MTTAFANITSAIIAALSQAPAVSDNIFRARDRSLAEDIASAINVQFDDADANNGAMFGAPIDWQSRISIECYAKSATTSGDLAVDPLLEAVFARLAADPTLGGVVADLSVRKIAAQNDTQGQKTGWIGMTYIVQHRTSNLTLG